MDIVIAHGLVIVYSDGKRMTRDRYPRLLERRGLVRAIPNLKFRDGLTQPRKRISVPSSASSGILPLVALEPGGPVWNFGFRRSAGDGVPRRWIQARGASGFGALDAVHEGNANAIEPGNQPMEEVRDVLIVEDSRLQAKRLRKFLEEHGMRVLVASNGVEGLRLAEEHRPPLIISDIIMPEMDGFEMCRRIKRDPGLRSIPVILLTSLSTPEDILRGLESGADSYVSKPFDGAVLLSRIKAVAAAPKLEEEARSLRIIHVDLGGKRYDIASDRLQILNLLLSTYQDVVLQNQKLRDMRARLVMLNEKLEKMVEERTTELTKEVAERRKAQEALAEQARELARSNAELEQFAYVASHDLQEPLRTVSNCAQLLARKYSGRLDEEADQFLTYAVEGVDRMRSLITGLLEYSRVETRGHELQTIDMSEVMENTLANLRNAIEENDAVVAFERLPTVKADARQMGQLLQNLVGNAVKFRAEEPPRIRVWAEEQNSEWVFAVQDNGIGLEPDQGERIFEIFQRLHSVSEFPGTGIGLAVCKKIVEQHGGAIWVESEPGRGTTFRFTLPRPDSPEEVAV